MPLYEYRCQDCGGVVEILQRVGQRQAGVGCPTCGSEQLERALSMFARAAAGGAGDSACAPGAFT